MVGTIVCQLPCIFLLTALLFPVALLVTDVCGTGLNVGANYVVASGDALCDMVLSVAGIRFWVFDVHHHQMVFKKALMDDQGIRYVTQGDSSGVAAALLDAVIKHNERNPGKEVIFLNYAAVDPDFTNSKCSYWHFRFDADTTMKMEAMSSYLVDQKDVNRRQT